jgi:hypothetical protein
MPELRRTLGLLVVCVLLTGLGARSALADPPVPVTLLRPVPVYGGDVQPRMVSSLPDPVQPVAYTAQAVPQMEPLVRGQAGDPAVPPPPVGGGIPPPPPPPGPGGIGFGVQEDPFNCGVVNDNPQPLPQHKGGPWLPWLAIPGITTTSGARCPFQSDHAFDYFISPVSNPLRFEDPRALTEIRPVFIYNWTPHSNPVFQGGGVGYFGTQLRVAFTDRLSLVINDLGFIWDHPRTNFTDIQPHTGFAEFHLGPKYTFIRSEGTGTVAAAGLNFDIPVGSHSVAQDTGTLSLTPYITGAQKICSPIGNFNAMATFGFSASVNNERSNYFFNSYHLDYDIANCHKYYPLVELNWFHYTNNGQTRDLMFEGKDLFNFGSMHIAGHNYLTMAVGGRWVPMQWLQFGGAFEFPLGTSSSRDITRFRLTFDVIFRY